MNGVTNVLGVELSQLTTEEERIRLQIEPESIDPAEKGEHAGGVWELFRTQTSRRATVSM